MKEKLQQKEVEFSKLSEESNKIKQELDLQCQKFDHIASENRKLENLMKKQEKGCCSQFKPFFRFLVEFDLYFIILLHADYTKMKTEYDVLFESNSRTEQHFRDVKKELKELKVRKTNLQAFLRFMKEKRRKKKS